MIAIGSAAPEFSGPTSQGEILQSTSLRGRPYVLYFFPKSGTPGCTAEANEFARHAPEFERAGVRLIGVSVDPPAAQRKFADDCHLPFPLVADVDRTIAKAYGVLGLLGFAKRVTFWVGADGKIQEAISGMLPGPHVRWALERLATPRSDPAGPAAPK